MSQDPDDNSQKPEEQPRSWATNPFVYFGVVLIIVFLLGWMMDGGPCRPDPPDPDPVPCKEGHCPVDAETGTTADEQAP